MQFNIPKNVNYCATVVEIKNIISLDNCDNIQATTIFGSPVIIDKTVSVGDVGVFFPAETQLTIGFVKNNNLYRHSNLNLDETKKGYLDDSRRIKTIRMRGNQSCGLFMPLASLNYLGVDINDLKVGDMFDEIGGHIVCNKYVITSYKNSSGNKNQSKRIRESKAIEGQFRLHSDTPNFGKVTQNVAENEIISITKKLHGTSVVISNILCKKKIGWFLKFLRWFKIPIIDTCYDNLYSSRKCIKNDDLKYQKIVNHYYDIDVWGIANNEILLSLPAGVTVYAEIVGYTPSCAYIQKGYDYGCAEGKLAVYIYRITYTNVCGDVFEFSARQVQDWCRERGLLAVPQLYYGYAKDVTINPMTGHHYKAYDEELDFGDNLLNVLKDRYLEKDCNICKNVVPDEGIVIRREHKIYFDAYKLKSFRFLEAETKALDTGEGNIEDNQ